MSQLGRGCVKPCTSRECAELFSFFSSFDGDCQSGSFLIQRNRDKLSTRKFGVRVFTPPGSSTDLTAPKFDFRSSPESGLKSDIGPCPFRATSGSRRIIRSPRRRAAEMTLGSQPERLRRPQIDDQLQLCRLQDRQVSWLSALENPSDLPGDQAIRIRQA